MNINKTKITAIALMTIGLASCSENDDLISGAGGLNDGSIGFSSYVGRTHSRAVVTNGDNLMDFGVFASHDKTLDYANGPQIPNYMYNQLVSKSGDSWVYNPIKYWPADATEKISFFAYSPYTASPSAVDNATTGITELSSNDHQGDPTLRFSVGTDVAGQIDLVYANAMNKTNRNKVVDLEFRHALSRVGFRVVGWDEEAGEFDNNTTVTINSVKLATTRQAATLNLRTGDWSDATESAALRSYTMSARNGLLQNNVIISGETQPKQLNLEGEYIMTLPDMSGSDEYILFVDYTVETIDNNLSSGSIVTRNNVFRRFTPKFQQGKSYIITIHLGMSGGPGSDDEGEIPTDPDPDPENPVDPTPAGNGGNISFSTSVIDWDGDIYINDDGTMGDAPDADIAFSQEGFGLSGTINENLELPYTVMSIKSKNGVDILKEQLTMDSKSFNVPASALDYNIAESGIPYKMSVVDNNGREYHKTVSLSFASMQMTIERSEYRDFIVPLEKGDTDVNIILAWGDGTQSDVIYYVTGTNYRHTYVEDGTFKVKIISEETDVKKKQMPLMKFNNVFADASKTSEAVISIDTPLLNMGTDNLENVFSRLTKLASIYEDVFINYPNAISFKYTFGGCSSLETIPAGIFKNNPEVTSFQSTFSACDKLVEIPENLFANNTKVENMSFLFASCPILSDIPAKLFENNTEVTDFSYIFSRCWKLTSLPDGLFANNLKAYNFTNSFAECVRLVDFENIFINEVNTKETRFTHITETLNISDTFTQVGKSDAETAAMKYAVNFNDYNIPSGAAFNGAKFTYGGAAKFANYNSMKNFYNQ